MTRINMTKYGFVRAPELDFSDDGNHFQCYTVGRVRVSKLVSKGEVYISGRIEGDKLTYDEYRMLPHYDAIDRLNGVSLDSLTDKDLIELYNSCVAYDAEYTAAESSSVYPTKDELLHVYRKLKAYAITEYLKVSAKITPEKLVKMSDYEIREFRRYLEGLAKAKEFNPEESADRVLGTARSKQVAAMSDAQIAQKSFYFTQCLKLLDK